MRDKDLISWRDAYAIGVDSVDYEHRQLISLINELYECARGDADKNAILEFLGDVLAQISAHFALEEKLMRERNYDEFEDHKQDHERLLDDISDIIDAYEADRFFSAESFGERLDAWFSEHFRTRDARFHGRLGGR